MKFFAAFVTSSVLGFSFISHAALKIDTATSKLTWTGSKELAGSHTGNIKISGGEITVDKNSIKSGVITIDMKSITNTDITDAKKNKDLVGHLSSPDFFAVEQFPTATMKITSVKDLGAGKSEVVADVTIRGKTEKVTFPAEIKSDKGQYSAKGKLSLDRTKFDVKYGSSNFFKLAADKVIKNNFDVEFEITAK